MTWTGVTITTGGFPWLSCQLEVEELMLRPEEKRLAGRGKCMEEKEGETMRVCARASLYFTVFY